MQGSNGERLEQQQEISAQIAASYSEKSLGFFSIDMSLPGRAATVAGTSELQQNSRGTSSLSDFTQDRICAGTRPEDVLRSPWRRPANRPAARFFHDHRSGLRSAHPKIFKEPKSHRTEIARPGPHRRYRPANDLRIDGRRRRGTVEVFED